MRCEYERSPDNAEKLTGNVVLFVSNSDVEQALEITIKDHSYSAKPIVRNLPAATREPIKIVLDQSGSHGWYDFSLVVKGFEQFRKRHAGRVETGAASVTDPYMGRIV